MNTRKGFDRLSALSTAVDERIAVLEGDGDEAYRGELDALYAMATKIAKAGEAPWSANCIWEDCDQEAVYCAGHALEYANVSDEKEASKLRHKVDGLAEFIQMVAEDGMVPGASEVAREVLKELGLPLTRGAPRRSK